ncbi:HNH endonuclease [Nocardiopsis sp. N85]|uniref:HNH endonuclease signature motif containing protein n=1 Tax=Nocardiopsis sp. N85 TaxID=3029400 RepID=UPI00237F8ED5|nr:HNH endonuclease signature motif containing protein [Nocardiopsis sp. N85]MDE3723654.1 HNH endonuclease [Nocardiopsis sp. N85]
MTEHAQERTRAPAGITPVDAAMTAAVDTLTRAFSEPVPAGHEAELLDQVTRVWQHIDTMIAAMLVPLARAAADGTLDEACGYRTLKEWMVHAFGISASRATDLQNLVMAFHHDRLPATHRAFHTGALSLGEAVAVVKATDKAVQALECATFPDDTEPISAGQMRQMMETGILTARENDNGALSVAQIGRFATRLQARLLPDVVETDHARAHAQRGARLDITPRGAFLLQVWGSAADGALIQACLDSYTPPPDPETSPHDTGGADSRPRRLYEAFTTAIEVAHTHHTCTDPGTPVVRLKITVPDVVLAGDTTAGAPVTDTGQVLPVSVLREWLTRAVIRPLFTNTDGVVTHVGENRRLASPGLRAAAFANHTTCAWPHGCDRPLRWCQADHITEFFQGGPTRADNLQPLCSTHNRIKHRRALETDRHRYWSGRPTRRPSGPGPTVSGPLIPTPRREPSIPPGRRADRASAAERRTP